ncbi:TolB family protein [Caenimonas koreensis]|uniref:TolB family protein n=1 Tax=Caenimonas koreensis TaxID=367474 RepID=UPI003782DCA1
MPIVIALLVAAIVIFLLFKLWNAGPSGPQSGVVGSTDRELAFLSNGQLFLREAGREPAVLDSPFVKEQMDRRERASQKQGWKEGTAFNIAAGGGRRGFESQDTPINVTSAAYEPSGSLLYALKDGTVGGVFRREAQTGRELRLLLKPALHISDLAVSPEGKRVAAASHYKGGKANIVVFDEEGNGMREVTGGDTEDSAPAWIPGVAHRLLFQSSGFARNEQGYIVAQGPASIQTLDMESNSVAPIVDDPAFDHLRPRVSPDGHLFYIRRPYELPSYSPKNILLDTLLFPFRLLRAVFHYLNFFSMMYTRKPLTSANGPKVEADWKNILVQGKRIDAEKALREARPVHGVPSLVPADWQLVRRSPQGEERVLATSVASYDIAPDGTVVYTNGRGVFAIEAGGATKHALTAAVVNDVMVAG